MGEGEIISAEYRPISAMPFHVIDRRVEKHGIEIELSGALTCLIGPAVSNDDSAGRKHGGNPGCADPVGRNRGRGWLCPYGKIAGHDDEKRGEKLEAQAQEHKLAKALGGSRTLLE